MFNPFKKLAFGLDISDYSIEALELERKFKRVYLGAYGRVILEKGIVENGKILDKEKLKEKIKELLDSTIPRKIRSNRVITSLPESKTFIHYFPDHQNIEEQALRTIPWEPEEIYFDYRDGLYAAAPKNIVNEYLEVLKSAGLKLLVLDIESGSLARAFDREMSEKGGILIADIGARTTNLTIVDKTSIKLSAIVPIAGNHFTQAISEKLNIPFEEAEEIKKHCGLDPEKREGKIMLILQGILRDILDDIKKAINFYEERGGRKIKKILLCGGSSFLPKLDSYIASNLGIETKIPDPWEGIDVEILFKKPEFRKIIETKLHPVYFANVIGLAKRGLEKNPEKTGINLLPKGH